MNKKVVEDYVLTEESWSDLMEGLERKLSYEILDSYGDEWLRYAFEQVDPGRRYPNAADNQPLICERLLCVAGLHLLLNQFMGCVVDSDPDAMEPDWVFKNSDHLDPTLLGLLCGEKLKNGEFYDEWFDYDLEPADAAFNALIKNEARSLHRRLDEAWGSQGLLVSMLIASGITSDGLEWSSIHDLDEDAEEGQFQATDCELAVPLFPVPEDVFASVVDGAYMSMSGLLRISERFDEI